MACVECNLLVQSLSVDAGRALTLITPLVLSLARCYLDRLDRVLLYVLIRKIHRLLDVQVHRLLLILVDCTVPLGLYLCEHVPFEDFG